MKTSTIILIGYGALMLFTVSTAIGQAPPATNVPKQMVYPAKGQTPAQQQKDESECSTWAVQQSGYDPANPTVLPKQKTESVVGSGAAVKGAAAGAAVGAIGGNDVGNAAAKGAAVGAVAKLRANRRAAEQANNASAEQQKQAMQLYLNARQVCLEARGYSVK